MKQKKLLRKSLILLVFVFLISCYSNIVCAGNWKGEPLTIKGFIENKGQFEPILINGKKSEVLYAYDGPSEDYFFTAAGVVLSFTEKQNHKKNDTEKIERQRRKQNGFKSNEEW